MAHAFVLVASICSDARILLVRLILLCSQPTPMIFQMGLSFLPFVIPATSLIPCLIPSVDVPRPYIWWRSRIRVLGSRSHHSSYPDPPKLACLLAIDLLSLPKLHHNSDPHVRTQVPQFRHQTLTTFFQDEREPSLPPNLSTLSTPPRTSGTLPESPSNLRSPLSVELPLRQTLLRLHPKKVALQRMR